MRQSGPSRARLLPLAPGPGHAGGPMRDTKASTGISEAERLGRPGRSGSSTTGLGLAGMCQCLVSVTRYYFFRWLHCSQ